MTGACKFEPRAQNFIILWDEQRGVAVAQETEIVSEGIVVDLMPIALDKGADQ